MPDAVITYQGQPQPQEIEKKKAIKRKYQAQTSLGCLTSGYSRNLIARRPALVIEQVNKFSTDIIKVSSSMSKINESKHTATHETQDPSTGTFVLGLKFLKVQKKRPSFAREQSKRDCPIILIKAEAVIPRKAHKYINPATQLCPIASNACAIAVSPWKFSNLPTPLMVKETKR